MALSKNEKFLIFGVEDERDRTGYLNLMDFEVFLTFSYL